MAKTRQVLRLGKDRKLEVKIDVEPKKIKETGGKYLAMISLASELGFSISLPIAGGAFLGHLLDNKFGTNPRLTLSLIFLGLTIGAANIYFIMKEVSKK